MNITRREALKAIATVAAVSAIPAIADSVVDDTMPGNLYEDKIIEAIQTAISRVHTIRGVEYNPQKSFLGITIPFNADMESIRKKVLRIYPEAADRLLIDQRGYYADDLASSYFLQVCYFEKIGDSRWGWSGCDTRNWKFCDSHHGVIA